ncbi:MULTISPECIES: ABC transporter ATP-binding protein [Streptomyces]|uniref:ABC transporter ATP-binding protein n=1 Tax=Streptomyces doudnae TaxID=3075536 RepID=A0ABD5ERL8_9ACTN|nr:MULTISPECIES: ABC transporter ATP-binding protein [unclassified Streptomyces]MDT0437308.1 ABC transporter ATP-binding protein [Streptomyces sp. DSM 41981]MYQ66273.1 ATP-binding cassette domain-containing protein [Streptomyces sp. SID4950]SCE17612.1 ATP-binding cassette, subfamily C [Streptomyces sp. SolWspMP-5a-2]
MTTPAAPTLLPVATGRQTRARLRRVLRGRGPSLSAVGAALVADSALGLAGPVATGRITQAIADGRAPSALVGPVLLLAGAAVAAALTGWAAAVLLARLVLPVTGRLREDAVTAALALPVDVVEAGGTGDLVSRVSGDADRVTTAASGALGDFVSAALAIAATLVGLAALDWRFALAGLLAVPIQAHTLRWYLRVSRPVYAEGRAADGRRASALLSAFTALPTLRALRLGASRAARVEEASEQAMTYEFRATRAATRFYGRLNAAEFTGLAAILLVAFALVRSGTADIGAATTAALFFVGLFDPVNTMLGTFDSVQQAGAGLARIVGVATLAAPGTGGTAPAVPARPAAPSAPTGAAVAVRGVHHRYRNGPDVLHGIDLDLPAGRHLAVVGATGSGKSTLATLIAGLRPPHTGEVTLGGVPTADLAVPAPDGRRRIALVTQEHHLFRGTLTDNLRLARRDAADRDIASALTAVGADWVAALPEGADTVVGTGATELTASQVQQLALARVLLLDPEVVVLDEATAEGGSDAARTLDRAARTVTEGRTAVVVAHRLSQAATADTVLVMDRGRVVEHGDGDRLRAAGGVYADLWAAWSGDGDGSGGGGADGGKDGGRAAEPTAPRPAEPTAPGPAGRTGPGPGPAGAGPVG